MASIFNRGRRFSVRFRYEGRQHRVTIDGGKAKAESVRLIVENTLSDLRLHRLTIPEGVDPCLFIASGGKAVPRPKSLTFGEACDLWASGRVAANTTRKVEAIHVRRFRAFFRSERPDRLDIQAYVDHRLCRVSGGTVRKELLTLRLILRHAERQGYAVSEIRTDRLRLPVDPPKPRFAPLGKAASGRRVLLTSEEVRELRTLVRERGSELIADVTDFIALTGCRRSEACRLRPGDIDLQAGSVTITELKRRHGHVTFRTLPIHPELLPILTKRSANLPHVFSGSVNTLSAGLQEAIRDTRFNVRGFGFHVLRHSAASRLLARQVSAVTVADVLGHASPATTLAVYSHAFDEDCEKAVSML